MKALIVAACCAVFIGCSYSKDIQVEMVNARLIKIDTIYREHHKAQQQLTWRDEDSFEYVCYIPLQQNLPLGTRMFVMRRR